MVRIRYLCKMYYFGSKKFFGSQRQKKILTIEDCVLHALLSKNYIRDIHKSSVNFASRTDRFVSARSSCFSFISKKEPILMEINSVLPRNIGVWAYSEVPLDFSSRSNALLRHYKYIVPESPKFLQNLQELDLKVMDKACKELEGIHDFINFCKRGKGEIRTVRELKTVKMVIDNNFIIFDFQGKSFLRQQIRRMVQKILELGMREISYDDFLSLFDRSKNISYQGADPRGLILWDIIYDENVRFIEEQKSKDRMRQYFLVKELNYQFKHQLFQILQHNNSS